MGKRDDEREDVDPVCPREKTERTSLPLGFQGCIDSVLSKSFKPAQIPLGLGKQFIQVLIVLSSSISLSLSLFVFVRDGESGKRENYRERVRG